MTIKSREISRELENELRAVTFSPRVDNGATPELEAEEIIPEIPQPAPPKPFSLNKRVVTLEYLDKFEHATKASAQYDSIQEFSHTISNLSIILLSASIIFYLVSYFLNPHSITLVSLLILCLEAFALLSLTLYSMSKASTAKQIRDILVSDFSTCSNAIGNPRADVYIPMDTSDIPVK